MHILIARKFEPSEATAWLFQIVHPVRNFFQCEFIEYKWFLKSELNEFTTKFSKFRLISKDKHKFFSTESVFYGIYKDFF